MQQYYICNTFAQKNPLHHRAGWSKKFIRGVINNFVLFTKCNNQLIIMAGSIVCTQHRHQQPAHTLFVVSQMAGACLESGHTPDNI